MSLTLKFLILLLYLFDSYRYILTSDIEATYENVMLLCNETAAVSSIKRIPVVGPSGKDYHFEINCTESNLCEQECEWSYMCTKDKYGQNVFIGGIHSLYFVPTQQRHLLLLCCNTTSEYHQKCSNHKIYTENEYVIGDGNTIFSEMITNEDPEEDPTVSVQICTYENDLKCPIVGSEEPVQFNADSAKLAGLAGLAGLALLPTGGNPCGCDLHITCVAPCIPEPGSCCDGNNCVPEGGC